MNNNTYSARLVEAMKEAGFTQASLAKAVGMSQSSIWKLTSGAASGSRKTVQLSQVLGVRPEWLSSGEGPKYVVGLTEAEESISHEPARDTYRVDVLDVQASAGPGTFVSSEFIETIRAIEYTRQGLCLVTDQPMLSRSLL